MKALDDFLMDKVFQSSANFVQRSFGRNCFFLARVCLMISASAWLLHRWESGFFQKRFIAVAIAAAIFWMYILLIRNMKVVEIAEKIFIKHFSKGLAMNPWRISMANARIFAIMGAGMLCALDFASATDPSLLETLLVLIIWFSWVSNFFFISCTPLPPCESKVKQWIKAIGKLFEVRPALVPVESRCQTHQ